MKTRTLDTTKRTFKAIIFATSVTFAFSLFLAEVSVSKTAKEIDSEVNEALSLFSKQVTGGKEFLNSAKGMLVVPNIISTACWVHCQAGCPFVVSRIE